jgi:uncharacterized protein (TIGR02001 family)
MKSIRTLALVTGLLALSGVSQAQFSSTWTFVTDYDFRGYSQSALDPAIQASADYAFGETGLAIGIWASNVDFGVDDDLETDYYVNYTGTINDTFAFTAGGTYYDYPLGNGLSGYPEVYVGLNAAGLSFKQWYSNDFYALDVDAQYTELNFSQSWDAFSLGLHVGYSWGDYWDALGDEVIDYAVQGNYTAGNVTFFVKFTATDSDEALEVTTDIGNNEPRFLAGVMTTLPWGD